MVVLSFVEEMEENSGEPESRLSWAPEISGYRLFDHSATGTGTLVFVL